MKDITHKTSAIAILSLLTLGSCERANDPKSAKGTSQVSFKMIYVMVDSVYHPLNTPSGQQSGLKLKATFTLVPNVDYSFYLDFDAAKSIVKSGNGKYNLKPVLYLIADAQSGSIDGYALPDSVSHHLSAISTTTNDTIANTYTDTTGYFLLMGLPQDVYNIYVYPGNGFAGQTLPGVNVVNGTTTFADTINL